MAALKRDLELSIVPGRAPMEAGWSHSLFDEALGDLKRMKGLFGWRRVRLVLENPYATANPLKTYIALLLMAPRSAELMSLDGRSSFKVNAGRLAGAAFRSASVPKLVKRATREVLAVAEAEEQRAPDFAPPGAPPFVWRPNLWFGTNVGGSYSHASGVLNGMQEVFGRVALATTDEVHSLHQDIAVQKIDLSRVDGWHCGAGLHFAANRGLFAEATRLCPDAPAFVYQRGALGDVSGLRLARSRRRPFVYEYNGPEVWVAQQWGDGVPYAEEFVRVETALLRKADLVLAVSQVLVREAISRGVKPERVLHSPNAVDPQRFHPEIDGAVARARLKLGARRAAILLSSFGPWHGVDVAIEA
ncbi:MAG: glycosyltransferase, partial [Parvularculaceae bacterium]